LVADARVLLVETIINSAPAMTTNSVLGKIFLLKIQL
jgi:hypothetical protein